MAEFWRSPAGKYPPAMLPYLHSDVEPAAEFDHPEYHRRIEPQHDPDWLGFAISKSLAGYGGRKPTCEEFVGWFRPGARWPAGASAVILMVMAELHRYHGMLGFWRLRDTLGVSIAEIAAAMRRAEISAAYPCLWINRYAWYPPPPEDGAAA